MCTIEGCEGKPVAKGLCSRHYMRLRRAGDPAVVRKPGPKPSEWSRWLQRHYGHCSARTRARFDLALNLLMGQPDKVSDELLDRATRSNGTVNVNKFLDMATAYVESLGK